MIVALALMQLASVTIPYSEMRYCFETRDPTCIREVITPRDLALINLEVSDAIITVEDDGYYDPWVAFPDDRRGDCDDDAATKRAALIGFGFKGPMRFETGSVVEPDGRLLAHIVLVVTLGGKDYVMDRKTPDRVYTPDKRPYTWKPSARQSKAGVAWEAAS